VIEAMMLGLPTVLFHIGPSRRFPGNGESAVLFRAGDAGDLASKLISWPRS